MLKRRGVELSLVIFFPSASFFPGHPNSNGRYPGSARPCVSLSPKYSSRRAFLSRIARPSAWSIWPRPRKSSTGSRPSITRTRVEIRPSCRISTSSGKQFRLPLIGPGLPAKCEQRDGLLSSCGSSKPALPP